MALPRCQRPASRHGPPETQEGLARNWSGPVQRLARRVGIDGQISPHSLRHTFATIALDSGTALHDLQDSMGHADPRTTRRYDRARNNLQKSAGYDVARALA
ncbi:tyrosine-type recombinase/integrase [Arthrobacter globiformis]|uniref:Tyr recombinase domain-containing protein n=1 Tax=Arthrobacter globiformis TaxID=1665 RepID=A0A328HGH6_ARTGO|nr:hypothetical protein DBZ45_08950 [Arthrobacter globiformis]